MPDDRSGVSIIHDHERRLVAMWLGVFLERGLQEQLEELRDIHPHPNKFECRELLERDSSCRVQLEFTPHRKIPVVVAERSPRIVKRKRLRVFLDDVQCKWMPIPRNWLESLAEGDFCKTWGALKLKQRLQILDHVVGLYAMSNRRSKCA
jgi:hypothetical protein